MIEKIEKPITPLELNNKVNEIIDLLAGGLGLPTGTIIPVNSNINYIPDGLVPCDGAEYTQAQFSDLWTNYLTGEEKIVAVPADFLDLTGLTVTEDGAVSGFNTSNYLKFNINEEGKTTKIIYTISMTDVTTSQILIYIGDGLDADQLYVNSGSLIYQNSNNNATVICSVEPNVKYTLTFQWSTTDKVYTLTVSQDDTTLGSVTTDYLPMDSSGYTLRDFGFTFTSGTLYLLESQAVASPNWYKFATSKTVLDSLLNTCSYTEYETDLATYGQCNKFAVDTDNLTFRVPLIKDTETVVTNNIDYENYITIDALPLEATPFTAPYDGVLMYTLHQNKNATITCYINGVARYEYLDGGSTNVPETYYTPLSKGDVLYWSASVTVDHNGFYAYKEEIKEKLKSFVVVANGQTNQSLMDWSAWASSLQGRLDTSVTNITGDGKANITDMLSPDYSAGVEKVWGETYTAEVSGWLYYAIRIAITASTTIDDYTCLWIDEVPVGVGGGQKSTSSSTNSGFVKIGKGSTYRTANPSGTTYEAQCIRFYPDKGVN